MTTDSASPRRYRDVAYDPGDRLTEVVLPTAGGNTNRRLGYSWTDDNLVSVIDAPSPATPGARVAAATYRYDGVGRQVHVQDPLGYATATSYTSDGFVARVEAHGARVSTYVYDADGNQISMTDPVKKEWTTVYSPDALVLERRDPLAGRTTYTYDLAGNPLTVRSPSANAGAANNPAGEPVRHTYTHDNLLLSTREPVVPNASRFRLTTYGYDSAGRKTSGSVDEVDAAGTVLEAGGTQRFAAPDLQRAPLQRAASLVH